MGSCFLRVDDPRIHKVCYTKLTRRKRIWVVISGVFVAHQLFQNSYYNQTPCLLTITPSRSGGEPHFDDEQTILTARPVVPLDQIKKLKLKSRCFVAGAFTVAMLLGGASGLLSAYYKLRQVRESGVAQVDVPTQAASEEPLASTVPTVAATEASNSADLSGNATR